MQKMPLMTAKAIVASSKTLLPLVYHRDKLVIVQFLSAVLMAQQRVKNARTEQELVQARFVQIEAEKYAKEHLPNMEAEASRLSKEAQVKLRKLTHPTKEDKQRPIQLYPRRIRRQAARIVAKEELLLGT